MAIAKELELNWRAVKDSIEGWIKNYFSTNKIGKAIIGISGGIDSAVVATLTVTALGREKVIGVLLPETRITPRADRLSMKRIVKLLKIDFFEIEIAELVKGFLKALPAVKSDLLSYANLKPRIRMTLLYAIANLHKGAVVGTGDRSEYYLGYFTKFGDGAADLFPLLGLYKTQVRELGRFLSLPKEVTEKISSPGLWKGQTAEMELGFSYEVADRVFFYKKDFQLLFQKTCSNKKIARIVGVSERIIKLIEERERQTAHKRCLPPSPPIPYPYFTFQKIN